MASTSKDKDSGRKGVKAQQRVGAGLEKKAGSAKAKQASRAAQGDPAHDSPKRHGDKLENARDAAAGRAKAN
jgi:hypothetical protein